jgi:coenzyme F420-reducing hydrogenase alpha subunit
MSETVRLDQVKRIEGHGRVSLFVDDDGKVDDAHFDILEFRGFEEMLRDRMVWEMPLITSRICGVCPVSHHLAAVKAVDDLYGVDIPPTARMLREAMHLGGLVQDHALHFFFLAGPDFLTGDGAGSRDILGVIKGAPELALKAIGIRKTGQHIVATIGGRASHPVTAIPGGMSKGIDAEQRDQMLHMVRSGMDDAMLSAEVAHESTMRLIEENPDYATTPMPMMAITTAAGGFELYDGDVTVMDTDGSVFEQWPVTDYSEHIAEKVVLNSYAKSPYLIAKGEEGSYRVGPLARLNIASSMPGERSQELMEQFRAELGRPVHATLAYHWARMIELVAGYERLETLLADDDIISEHVRVQVNRGPGSGTACTEAPRGTLIHHYEADDVGRVTKAELIVATTHNTASLDAAVLEAVSGTSKEDALSEEAVRRMELGIRAHDPCLSCATHEIGRMPLVVEVHAPDGTVLGRKEAV